MFHPTRPHDLGGGRKTERWPAAEVFPSFPIDSWLNTTLIFTCAAFQLRSNHDRTAWIPRLHRRQQAAGTAPVRCPGQPGAGAQPSHVRHHKCVLQLGATGFFPYFSAFCASCSSSPRPRPVTASGVTGSWLQGLNWQPRTRGIVRGQPCLH